MSTQSDSSFLRDSALFDLLLKAGASVPSKERTLPFLKQDIRSGDAMPGQVWRTKPSPDVPEEDALTHWVLVLGRHLLHETPVYRIAPMFTDTVMADPQDAVLPPEILGFEAAFALGLTVSTTSEALDSCVLTLPREWADRLLGFGRCVDGRSQDRIDGIDNGIPYIDELDGRIDFHAELLEELGYLQSATARFLAEQESAQQVVIIVDPGGKLTGTPSDPAHRAAAATPINSTEAKPSKRFVELYEVVQLGVLVQLEANDLDSDLRLVAATKEGHPSHALDGFTLLTGSGGEFPFRSGEASIPLQQFSGSLQLVSASGLQMVLRRIQH
jgi:hypothetical protein